MGRNNIALSVLFTFILTFTNANVIGFDFGTTFFKITLVKPGSPFSIVENLTSKRKTESMMSFGAEQRLFSADSIANHGRYLNNTFTDVASYIGMEFNADVLAKLRQEKIILNNFVEDERGLVAW